MYLYEPKKRDYLNSLNRVQEKVIYSNFSLQIQNDMIAIELNWEERLRPKNEKGKYSTCLDNILPHLITLSKTEKKLNSKAMITYKKHTNTWQKLTHYKHLTLHKTKNQMKSV